MTTLQAIAGAIIAICGLVTLAYKHWWSPAAKMRKQALKDGKAAVDAGDVSGITSTFDRLRRKIFSLMVILLIFVVNCKSPNVILNPITPQDIITLKKGETIEWYDQEGQKHTGAPKDGCFLSNQYLKDVMEAKIQ